MDVTKLQPPPLEFGLCPKCAYLSNDSALICYSCARRTMEPLAPVNERCWICDQPFAKGESECGNILCGWDESERWFNWNYSIAMKTGAIERAIWRYKYEGAWGWKIIFGRLVVGFLDDTVQNFESFDLIIPSPTYVEEGGRREWDHTGAVIESAAQLNSSWPFHASDPQLVIKTADTPTMAKKGFSDRRYIAEHQLRDALKVTDPGLVAGKRILVFDDVFTIGLTLREVARVLRVAGALEVCGLTLARQPWGS